jgi:hypothetical protein
MFLAVLRFRALHVDEQRKADKDKSILDYMQLTLHFSF